MSGKFEQLKAEIFKRSIEKNIWVVAVLEWEYIDMGYNHMHCLCGQEIGKEFIIENKLNGKRTSVGSVCINQFMGDNEKLIKDVARAEYEFVCHPWGVRG